MPGTPSSARELAAAAGCERARDLLCGGVSEDGPEAAGPLLLEAATRCGAGHRRVEWHPGRMAMDSMCG